MKYIFTFLFITTFLAAQSQSIVYVTPSGTGNQSGGSWSNALPGSQLQSRLALAGAGTQFWITAGTYKPTTGTDRSISFFIPSGVQVYGGFTGYETTLSDRKVPRPSSTILSGYLGTGNAVQNTYHVVVFRNASADTRLDGVFITSGNANGSSNFNNLGGGIYNDGSNGGRSEPLIFNCQIRFNSASSHGGGMYNNGEYGICAPKLINCFIENNSAQGGFGGGLYNDGLLGVCNTQLINCFMGGNSALQGSAMLNEGLQGVCSPVLINCIFKGNIQAQAGGGVLFNRGINGTCQPSITNCIFWENPYSRPSLHNDSAAPIVTYSDLEDGYSGTGNISQDPKFFNFYTNDFRFLKDSPAINAGDPTGSTTSEYATDYDGKPRIYNGRIDMGLIEYVPNSVTGVVRVTESGSGDYVSGNSWANALAGMTLQAALSEADSGTVFWLAGGTYKPTFTVGDRVSSFTIPSGVRVYGGFAGIETSLADRQLANPSSTTLSGDIGYTNDTSDNSYHVVIFKNSSARTRLDGVLITGGNANGDQNKGGGIYCDGRGMNNRCEPTIANCVLINNSAQQGGGQYNDGDNSGNASPTVINSIYEQNKASIGGGTFNGGLPGSCSPTYTTCRFLGNSATTEGGAIYYFTYFGQSKDIMKLTNCIIRNNKAAEGAGIYCGNSYGASIRLLVTNCLFDHNQASSRGGAFNVNTYASSVFSTTLINCTVTDNQASTGGNFYSNIGLNTTGAYTITNTIIRNGGFSYSTEDNTMPPVYTVNYSNIQGGFAGTGNIDQDPLFADAANGNYRLKIGSPSINTGDPNSTTVTVSEKDLDGNVRIAQNRIDMGSYEFQIGTEIYTITDGLWNNSSVWSVNRLPLAGERVQLRHRITLPSTYQAQAGQLSYNAGGQLIYSTDASLRLTP